jgi:PAS domain S-box-containing protein
MPTSPESVEYSVSAAKRIIFIYAAFASVWILVSDNLVSWLFSDPHVISRISLAKGWLFVAVTALLLYGLIRRMQKQAQEMSERELAVQKDRASIRQLLDNLIESSSDAIYAKDLQGRYLLFNKETARVLGTTSEKALGNDDSALFPNQLEMIRANDLRAMSEDRPITCEETITTVMGVRTFLATKGPLRDAEGTVIGLFGISRDITERKQSEQLLRQSIKDKHALLLEVHHRVKNNLQLIVSLLRMEARRSAVAGTQAALGSMQGRIQSMALLHESLYRSGTFASVDLGTYLGQLAIQAFKAQVWLPDKVQLKLNMGSVLVGMDQAICAGLLANELISNALKHGFTNGRGGELMVDLQPTKPDQPPNNARWRLCVRDSGVGLPADFESRRQNSLGLQLVSDLSQQLGGTLDIESQPNAGATFTVVFVALEPAPLVMPE